MVILTSDSERTVYLELLQTYLRLHDLSLLGYCLMSNHVHLLLIPRKVESLATALKQTHGRYASYWNATHKSSGHVWQGRFYSCPLDDAHLWVALRYAERNPVRAQLAAVADSWPWSNAGAHCGVREPPPYLDLETWAGRWSAQDWREYLSCGDSEMEIAAIRQCTHTGRPLGSEDFVHSLERATLRSLMPRKGGRPGRGDNDPRQGALTFDA